MTTQCVPISEVEPRTMVTVRGRIVSIHVEPADAAPSLTARVQDATGRIEAVFMGRRSIPGIEPGQHVVLAGRVAATGAMPRLFNPRYELQCRE